MSCMPRTGAFQVPLSSVIAGAGVLFVVTSGALCEVESELLRHGLAVSIRLEHDDDGKVVSFGEGLCREESVALLGKCQGRGIRAISSDDGDFL